MTTQEMLDVLLKKYAADPNVLAVSLPRKVPHGGIALEVCTDSSTCTHIRCLHLFGSDETLRNTEAILMSKNGYFDRKFFRTATLKAASKGHRLLRSFTRKLFPMEAECADRVQDFSEWQQYTSVWFLNGTGELFFPKTLVKR